jgi:hypothetical protein
MYHHVTHLKTLSYKHDGIGTTIVAELNTLLHKTHVLTSYDKYQNAVWSKLVTKYTSVIEI